MATMPYAREIKWRSWFEVVSTLILMVTLVVVAAWPALHWALRIGSGIFAGLVTIRMFIVYHDYLHGSLLKNSLIGSWIMKAFGIYVLAPASIWKRSHDYHHKHNSKLFTASIGSYPILTLDKFMAADRKTRKAYLYARHPLTIMAGYYSMFVMGMCIRSLRSSGLKHWDSALALTFHALIYGLLAWIGGWQAVLFAWFIPFAIATAIGAYLFYVQHNFPGVTFANKEEWTYYDAALQSSSYMRMGHFMRWVTGNIGYHHIHHLNERIPFYRLPEVYRSIPELQQAKVITWAPRDVWASLRLKVWNPDANEMQPLPKMVSDN